MILFNFLFPRVAFGPNENSKCLRGISTKDEGMNMLAALSHS